MRGAQGVSPDDIDRALTEVKLSPADITRVKELRAQIVERRNLGDPNGAAAAGAEAMKIMEFHLQMPERLTRGCGGRWVPNPD